MQRRIIETTKFTKEIEALIEGKKVLPEDYTEFKKTLTQNPNSGDLIKGTGGVRKTRLKSSTKGKSGGFRVCYYDDPQREELFLIIIYQKNEKVDLSSADKKSLKQITDQLKGLKK